VPLLREEDLHPLGEVLVATFDRIRDPIDLGIGGPYENRPPVEERIGKFYKHSSPLARHVLVSERARRPLSPSHAHLRSSPALPPSLSSPPPPQRTELTSGVGQSSSPPLPCRPPSPDRKASSLAWIPPVPQSASRSGILLSTGPRRGEIPCQRR
jgi:hypothetical protein